MIAGNERPKSASGSGAPVSLPSATTLLPPTLFTLFRDDFSELGRWDQSESEYTNRGNVEGAYRIAPKTGGYHIVGAPTGTYPGGLRVEVDAIPQGERDDVAFGVYCRRAQSREGAPSYVGFVDTSGSWRITKYFSGGQENVLNAAPARSVTARALSKSHITLDCVGGDSAGSPVVLRLAVDGKLVGEARDENGLAPGSSGFMVRNNRSTPAEVRFDNFVLSRI